MSRPYGNRLNPIIDSERYSEKDRLVASQHLFQIYLLWLR